MRVPLRFLAVLFIGLTSGEAFADCPSIYSGLSCTILVPVCTLTSQVWTCNVTSGASTATITEDYDNTVLYEAWGSSNGTNFCCSVAIGNSVTAIVLNGSSAADTLRFSYPAGGNNLHAASGTSITATINAGGGNDGLYGSDDTSTSTYVEHLYGGANNDTINAGDGDDYCYGGDDDDTINAGGGADTVDAGAGDDVVTGGAGIDIIDLGPGADRG